MATYYAGGVEIQIEECGTGAYGKTRYRGTVQVPGPQGCSWAFTDLECHGGDLAAAEAALDFACYYTSDNRGDDVGESYPSGEVADQISEAAVDALTSDTLAVGLEKGDNTDPAGGALFIGDCYVIADSRETFARFIARENARFYREESAAKRAAIKRREAAGESILSPAFPDSPWAEVSRLNGQENEARVKAGLSPRRDAYAWPGGYPIIYLDACDSSGACPDSDPGSVLCADCATDHEDRGGKVAPSVHYEGAPEECSACGKVIESAYGDPAAPKGEA